MKKKIIIGSMLVLTLLLLMPSIPAIQQKTIEDKAYSDLVEKFEDVDVDFIELLKDVDLEDLQEKIVNSETFKKLTSTDFAQTLINNNYDFDVDIYPIDILVTIVALIVGFITWIPAFILFSALTGPRILLYTITSFLYNFPWYFSPFVFLDDLILSFLYGLENGLPLLIVAIIWPLFLVYFVNNYNLPWWEQKLYK